MKLTRFPRLGVAGWRVAVVVLVGGCSSLTGAPPVSLDGGGGKPTSDGAGPAEAGHGSDGVGASRADSESDLAFDAQLADAIAEVRDDAAKPVPGLDAAGDFGGEAVTGDGGGAAGETGDASLILSDANIPADEGGASQADSLLVIDLAAGDYRIESVADGPGEDAGSDGSVSAADVAGADTVVQPDVAKPSDVTSHPDVVSVPFTVNAGADQSICAGWPATLSAQTRGGTPPYAYAWSANPACFGCLSSAATAQTDVVPSATTTFTVTAHDWLGAVATDSVVITVVNPVADGGPEVSADPGAPVRIGTPARAGYTYLWTCDRPTCALSSTTTAQPTVTPRLSTMYTVAVTSPEGCTASDSTTVWVNLPVITTPEDGEPAYPVSASLLVQFGAGVRTASISTDTVLLRETASGTPVPFTYAYNPSLRALTITPTGANYNATLANYTLTLVGGASGIVSNDSLRPQRLPADVVISFTLSATPDSFAPTIVSRSPAPLATGVATNTSVSATFSEALDPATITAANFAVSSGPGVAGTLSYDAKTSSITFVPAATLTTLTAYTVGVTGIKDLSGNLAANSNWSFTTGRNSDTAAPTVMAVSPASGATRVSVGTSVGLTFSESVDPTTLPAGIQVAAGTTSVAGTVACDATNQVATFTPSAPLANQTLYTVTVAGVTDLAGNAMTAAFTSTFTTTTMLFADSFESGSANWTLSPPWGLTTSSYMSPNHSLTDSPAGNYAPFANTSATSAVINITNIASVSLSYWLSGQTQPQQPTGGDVLYVEYTINGGATWPGLANYSGTLAWAQHIQTIPPGPGTFPPGATNLQIRFRLTSNGNQQFDGVYVDDVTVQAN